MNHLLLDLEDTVITPVLNGWFNTHLINVPKIRRVLEEFRPDQVSVFSFAVWNEAELKRFNMGTRPMIESAFGFKFELVPTVDDDIIPACCSEMNIHRDRVDFQDASNFWSKQGAFRHWARVHIKALRRHEPNLPIHMLLLDDAVYNEQVIWKDLNAIVEQQNIDQLP